MNLDFLNLNTLRNYPIADDLGRVSVDGYFTLPNDLIADMSIVAPSSIGPNTGNPAVDFGSTLQLFISGITNTTAYISIEVSANAGPIGNFYIVAGTDDYTDIIMSPTAAFPTANGVLTIGSLNTITTLQSGSFVFAADNTALVMRVYIPTTTGVNFISFIDNVGNSTTLTGTVIINAESNLQFRTPDGNTVYIDAGEGLGLNTTCEATPTPIQTINGIPPDDTGNFTLIPSTCISIDPAEAAVIIANTCGTPCLGCSDISTLTNRLVSLETDLLTVRNYVNNLQGLITQVTNLITYECSC